MPINHNNAISSKKSLLLSSHIKFHQHIYRTVFACKQLDLWIFFSWFRRDNIFTGECNIIDRGLLLYPVNIWIIYIFNFITYTFSLQNINWWTGIVWITCGLFWCFYQLFGLLFWRHPLLYHTDYNTNPLQQCKVCPILQETCGFGNIVVVARYSSFILNTFFMR